MHLTNQYQSRGGLLVRKTKCNTKVTNERNTLTKTQLF